MPPPRWWCQSPAVTSAVTLHSLAVACPQSLDQRAGIAQIKTVHPAHHQVGLLEPLFPQVVGSVLCSLAVVLPVKLRDKAGLRVEEIGDPKQISVRAEDRLVHSWSGEFRLMRVEHPQSRLPRARAGRLGERESLSKLINARPPAARDAPDAERSQVDGQRMRDLVNTTASTRLGAHRAPSNAVRSGVVTLIP
jgi:hypothetical protein